MLFQSARKILQTVINEIMHDLIKDNDVLLGFVLCTEGIRGLHFSV